MADQDQLFSGLSDDALANVERYRDAAAEIQKNFQAVNRSLRRNGDEAVSVGRAFGKISAAADAVREIQDNITDSVKSTELAVKAGNKQRSISRQLSVKIDQLLERAKNSTGDTADNLRKQAYNLSEARDQANGMAEAFDQIAEDSASLDKSAGTFGKLAKIFDRIPALKGFSKPFSDASKAAKDTALSNAKTGKSMSTLNAATKAFGKSLGAATKAFLPLLAIDLIIKAFKFVADLFVSADKTTTQLAKNLGISKSNAEGLRQEFVEIAKQSNNALVTSKSLTEAIGELTKATGAVTVGAKNLATDQVFLTKNLGIAGDKAAEMQLMFNATGQNVSEVIDSTIEFANQQAKANGFLISGQDILREISTISAEVSGYYGFNNKALAKAIVLSRRYGLSLMQTQSISKSLLDFESSISSELEAELLTGRQLNFEKARFLALTGDSAGAAAEVLKQAQNLTKEQRKNPIIMSSMAKATGLTVEELNKAFLIEENLKMSRKEYNKLLEQGSRLGKRELVEQLGLQGASREEIQKTLDAQEKFAAALEKAKDQFTGLVNSGALDKLVDLLIDFVDRAGQVGFGGALMGRGTSKAMKENAFTSAKESFGFYGNTQKGIGMSLRELASKNALTTENLNKFIEETKADKEIVRQVIKDRAQSGAVSVQEQRQYETLRVDDFTIKSNPKDTLVMAGGTKFGEETNTLLKELISAVKDGKTINLDGRKVNQGLAMASSKLDRYQ